MAVDEVMESRINYLKLSKIILPISRTTASLLSENIRSVQRGRCDLRGVTDGNDCVRMPVSGLSMSPFPVSETAWARHRWRAFHTGFRAWEALYNLGWYARTKASFSTLESWHGQ
jgi:hypothetical protein